MKLKALIIFAGYVESNHVAGVPFWHERGFDSVEKAVEHLGKTIETAFWRDKYQPDGCCVGTRDENPSASYCLECGRRLEDNTGPDMEQITSVMQCFLEGTCDSIGSAWEDIESEDWTFGPGAWAHLLKEDVVVMIHTHGEHLLAHGSQQSLQKPDEEKQAFGADLAEHIEIGFRSEVRPLSVYKE
jgi:hypothetical protein